MANPLRRIVQLVLDKASAKKTGDDVKASLSGAEGALNKLGTLAKRVGALLAAAFAVHKIIEFGKSAVHAAIESEKSWTQLIGTLKAMGIQTRGLEGDLRALGLAFQDVTTHSDEEFADSLMRMTTLTGDFDASLNNMGLVANVAAQFFKGELAPAVELVSKVMNGNVMMLQRMGIHVKNAQEGLQLLATRSMGAATREAGTFGGKLKIINNHWEEFKEQLGDVLVGSDKASGALDVLLGVVKSMIKWVQDNKDALREFVTQGVMFAIDAFKALSREVITFLQVMGKLPMTFGNAAAPLATTQKGLKAQIDWFAVQRKRAQEEVNAIQKTIDDLKKETSGGWVGHDQRDARLESLAQDLATANDGLEKIEQNAKNAKLKLDELEHPGAKPPSLNLNAPPKMGKNANGKDDVDDVTKALNKFTDAMRTNHFMSGLLGKDFDALGGEAAALQEVIGELSSQKVLPPDAQLKLKDYAARYKELTTSIIPTTEATTEFEKALNQITVLSPLFGKDLDVLATKIQAVQTVITKLAEAGFQASNPVMLQYAATLSGLRKQLSARDAEEKYKQALADIAEQNNILAISFDENGQRYDDATIKLQALQSEAQSLTDIIMQLHREGFSNSDPILVAYIKRLGEVQGAMKTTAEGSKLMADAAELAGEIVGAAMGAGIGPFAKAKARQNLIEAAEELVRAGISLLTPFGQAAAAKHAVFAAKHVAIAGAWSALAGAMGGGGAAGGGAGGGVGAAQSASGSASTRAQAAQQEVHIHLDGPGYDALNPRVQKVTFGALQEIRQRYGNQAKVILTRDGR